jgi:hypothetical protein
MIDFRALWGALKSVVNVVNGTLSRDKNGQKTLRYFNINKTKYRPQNVQHQAFEIISQRTETYKS